MFYSPEINTEEPSTKLIEGMKLDVYYKPADRGLILVENMELFYSNIENYEKIEVGGLSAGVVENSELGYSKATCIFDNINGLMFIVVGNGDSGKKFLTTCDEIVNSFVFTNR